MQDELDIVDPICIFTNRVLSRWTDLWSSLPLLLLSALACNCQFSLHDGKRVERERSAWPPGRIFRCRDSCHLVT